jgi:hypothetical protein
MRRNVIITLVIFGFMGFTVMQPITGAEMTAFDVHEAQMPVFAMDGPFSIKSGRVSFDTVSIDSSNYLTGSFARKMTVFLQHSYSPLKLGGLDLPCV